MPKTIGIMVDALLFIDIEILLVYACNHYVFRFVCVYVNMYEYEYEYLY